MSDALEKILKEFGFSLWQERAPQGPWFIETPEDDHIFFGKDLDSARQCLMAISRLCLALKTASGEKP